MTTDRIEQAAPDVREVLYDAWDVIAPERGIAWARKHARRFGILIDAEAYTDAALMLVPDGWWLQHLGHCIGGFRCRIETNGPPSVSVDAGFNPDKPFSTQALAICEASLRAKVPGYE